MLLNTPLHKIRKPLNVLYKIPMLLNAPLHKIRKPLNVLYKIPRPLGSHAIRSARDKSPRHYTIKPSDLPATRPIRFLDLHDIWSRHRRIPTPSTNLIQWCVDQVTLPFTVTRLTDWRWLRVKSWRTRIGCTWRRKLSSGLAFPLTIAFL